MHAPGLQLCPIFAILWTVACHSLQHNQVRACMFSCSVASNCSPPGSSVHEIFQRRTLEWVVFLFQGIEPTQIEPESPALTSGFFYHLATWEAQHSQDLWMMDLEPEDRENFWDRPRSAPHQGRDLNDNPELPSPRPVRSPLWLFLSLHNWDSCWIIEAPALSISGILLFDFVVPEGKLRTADASAGTETATESRNLFP